jgi:hypothetical protein
LKRHVRRGDDCHHRVEANGKTDDSQHEAKEHIAVDAHKYARRDDDETPDKANTFHERFLLPWVGGGWNDEPS